MTTATVAPEARRTRSPFVADERLLRRRRVGPADRLSIGDVLAVLPRLPDWPTATGVADRWPTSPARLPALLPLPSAGNTPLFARMTSLCARPPDIAGEWRLDRSPSTSHPGNRIAPRSFV